MLKGADKLYLDALCLAFMLAPVGEEEEMLQEIIQKAFKRMKLGDKEQHTYLSAAAEVAWKLR